MRSDDDDDGRRNRRSLVGWLLWFGFLLLPPVLCARSPFRGDDGGPLGASSSRVEEAGAGAGAGASVWCAHVYTSKYSGAEALGSVRGGIDRSVDAAAAAAGAACSDLPCSAALGSPLPLPTWFVASSASKRPSMHSGRRQRRVGHGRRLPLLVPPCLGLHCAGERGSGAVE
jgi:hypothetical protein